MILLATFSLLAASTRPPQGVPALQSPRPPTAAGAAGGVSGARPAGSLPKQAGPWQRPDEPRRITEQTIFDYMDGAGELYLAYRFLYLDVYEYLAADRSLGTIRVELYWMKGSDDAFGLLSTDWGGEAIDLGRQTGDRGRAATDAPLRPGNVVYPAVPPHTGLYGGGLLRFWSGDLYGRVMATRESPQSRAQVLAITRAIVEGRPGNAEPPEILSRVPIRLDARLAIRSDRTCFFRSHLVLNSAYYLAAEDVLGLGPSVDASISEYRSASRDDRPVRLIQIVYPTPDAVAAALQTFQTSYLAAPAGQAAPRAGSARSNVERTWVGWAAGDRTLAVVLDAPGARASAALAAAALADLTRSRKEVP